MKKSNRLLNFLLAFVLLFISMGNLVGCGDNGGGSGGSDQYKVTLNVDGKTTSYLVFKGRAFAEPTTKPKKTDYVFAGWYTEDTFENEYDFSSIPTSNFTLYAKFVYEYEAIEYNEQKLFTGKNSESITKLEYVHSTSNKTVLTVNGTGNINVKIYRKTSTAAIFDKSSSDGGIVTDLDLAEYTYRIIITGQVSSVSIGQVADKTLTTALVSVEDTLEFTDGVSTRKLFAHLSGEYQLSFNYGSLVNVAIFDWDDNAVSVSWNSVAHVYIAQLEGNNWYKVKVEYDGNETITGTIDYYNQKGETVFDTVGKITLLTEDDEDDEVAIYKAIIKPTIGSEIMLIPRSTTITNINIYDGERNLVKTIVNEDKNSNGLYYSSICLDSMEAQKDFYYVEMKFDIYSYYRDVYYIIRPNEQTNAIALETNITTTIEPNETSMYWYKFQPSEDDKYTLSSGGYSFIFNDKFEYQKMTSSTTLQLEAGDIIYIGIMNTSTSNSSLVIKDSFATAGTMGEYTYTRSASFNDMYRIFDSLTRKHRWIFAASGTTLTIMDENKNVLTSYTSSSSNDEFRYEITAETKYYVRLKSSVGGNYTYEKAVDKSNCQDYSSGEFNKVDGEIWTGNKGVPSHTVSSERAMKMYIPTSGYYTFYAIKESSNYFVNGDWNIKKLYQGDFYILDEDGFYDTNIVVKYDGTVSPAEKITQRVWLDEGYIYFASKSTSDSYLWFIKS